MKKKLISGILLSLVMVLGLMTGMSVTAYADNPYTGAAKIQITDVGGRIKNATTDWADGSPTTSQKTLRKTTLPCTFSLSDLSGNSNSITGLTTNSGTNVVINQTNKTVTINDLGSSEIVVNTTNNSGYTYKHTYTFEVTELATYSVTLHTNDGTISEGKNVTSYVQEMGAALPTSADITNGDKVFEGWFDNSGLTGNAVTSISTTDTGNKEYWAKWKTPHTHSFTYAASGATITATCSNTDGCPLSGSEYKATLTIAAPTMTVYQETGKSEVASLTGLEDFNTATGKSLAVTNIKYVGRDGTEYTESTTAPTNAGKYTATITLSGVKTSAGDNQNVTASVDYEIAKAATTVSTAPTAGEITYGKTLADSTLTGGTASVAGTFAWKNTTIAPAVSDSETTEYDVVFTPTDGNYSTAECKVTLKVFKADPAYTVGQLSAFREQTLADVALPTADNGTWSWMGDTSTTLNEVGETVYYAKFTPNDTENYNILENVEVRIQVTEKPFAVPATVTANSRTYDGTEKPLVNVDDSTLVGGTMQYAIGTKDAATQPYTTSIPTGTEAGTYYVWYKVKGDENHSDAAPAGPVTVTINAAGLKILCDPENGGRVELVSSGEDYVGYTAIPAEGWKFLKWTYNANVSGIGPQEFSGKDAFFMFTATDIVAHFVKGDDEMVTITFDAAGGTGTMAPVQIDKESKYTFPNSSFIPPADKVFAHWKIGEKRYAVNDVITVNADLTVTAVWTEEKSEEEKSEDKESKIVSDDLTSVPDELKNKFSSIKDLKDELIRALSSKGMFASEENSVLYDVVLMVRRNGGSWERATKEDFEDGPLTVKLEYPAGTGMNTHNFTVVHMFTAHTPGEVEIPAVTKKEDGIYVNLDGLSPVAISWTKIDEKAIDLLPQTGDTERPLIYGLVALAACIGVGLLIKKK